MTDDETPNDEDCLFACYLRVGCDAPAAAELCSVEQGILHYTAAARGSLPSELCSGEAVIECTPLTYNHPLYRAKLGRGVLAKGCAR